MTVFRDYVFFDKLQLSDYVKMQSPHDIIIYRFAGTLNYLNIEGQLEQVKQLLEPKTVIFSFGQVNSIDIDGIETFEVIFSLLKKKGIEMYFTGISNPYVEIILRKLPIYKEIEKSGNIYKSSAFIIDKLGLSSEKKS